MSANPSNQGRRKFAAALWSLLGVAALILAERRINGGQPLSWWLSLPGTGIAIFASLYAFSLHSLAKMRQRDMWPIALTLIFPAAIAGSLISIQSAVGAAFVAVSLAASVVAILAIRGEANIAPRELPNVRSASAIVPIVCNSEATATDADRDAIIEEPALESERLSSNSPIGFNGLFGSSGIRQNSDDFCATFGSLATSATNLKTRSESESPDRSTVVPPLIVAASTFLLADAIEAKREPAITQWLKRFHAADGSERIEGELSVRIPEGQLQETVHIPFSPPFSRAPHIECELTSGDAARAKIAAAYPFGARIEIKRPSAATVCTVRLAFFADSQRKQIDAA